MISELDDLKSTLDGIVAKAEQLDREDRVEFCRYLGEKHDGFEDYDFRIGDEIRDEGGEKGVCIAPDEFLFFGDHYKDGIAVFDIRDLGKVAFTGNRYPDVPIMLDKIRMRMGVIR